MNQKPQSPGKQGPIGPVVYENTVRVKCPDGIGSGFFVHGDKGLFLVTAEHVLGGVSNGEEIEVENSAGGGMPIIVQRLPSIDPNADIAVVRISGSRPPTASFETSKEVYVGEEVYLAGYPWGLGSFGANLTGEPPFVRKGVVSGLVWIDGVPTFWLDLVSNKGFSGGPVFRVVNDPASAFEVIGVLTSTRYSNEDQGTIGFSQCTPVEYAVNAIKTFEDQISSS